MFFTTLCNSMEDEIHMRGDTRKGDCNVCGREYEREIYECVYEDRTRGWALRPCPHCGYDIKDENAIRGLIQQNMSVQINHRGKISFNSDELSDLVVEKIKEIWPKGK